MTMATKAGVSTSAAPETELRRGRCPCGAVTCPVSGPMRSISLCRCGQCRREVGHARASVTAPRVAVAVARPVAWFRLGDEAERGFRPRVSASMFWRMDGADTRSVPLARRDSPARLILEKHIIASHTGDYCEIEGDLPRSP